MKPLASRFFITSTTYHLLQYLLLLLCYNTMLRLEALDINDTTGVERWQERFQLYCLTNKEVTAHNKTAFYLTLAGKEAYNLLVHLADPDKVETQTVSELQQHLVRHLTPANFEATERAKFHNIVRQRKEKLRSFLLRIQQQAAKCNFGDQLWTAMRDRVIAGVNFPEVQRKLLADKGMTFEKAKLLLEESDGISSVLSPTSSAVLYNHNRQQERKPTRPTTNPQSSTAGPRPNVGACYTCGENHLRANCRFRNAKCHNCQNVGHIKKACKQKVVTANMISEDDCDITSVLNISGNQHLRQEL